MTFFELSTADAGFRTAGFIVIATLLRPIGGMLGDKYDPITMVIISFVGLTFSGLLLSFTYESLIMFTIGCLLTSVFAGIGNGLVFKFVPMYFSQQSGIANGFVAMMGGLGGFFPPLVMQSTFEATGTYMLAFHLLTGACVIALFTMFYLRSKVKANSI